MIGFIGAVLLVVSVAAKWFNLWGQFPAALPFRSQSAMAVDSGVGCRSRCGNQERSSGYPSSLSSGVQRRRLLNGMIHHRTAMASPTMPATIPAARWLTTSEITKYEAKVMAAESGISPMMTWRLTERLKAARSVSGLMSRCWAAGAMKMSRLIIAQMNNATYTALSSRLIVV